MRRDLLFRALLFSSLVLTGLLGVSAQEFKSIKDGVEYAEFYKETKDGPVRGNLLRLDLSKVRLDVVHARDMVVGVETTSALAKRYGALAAINTGFFKINVGAVSGVPVGIMRVDGNDFTDSYGGRIALFIANGEDRTLVAITRVNKETFLKVGKSTVKVGYNKIRDKDDAVVYTGIYNRSTLTNQDGVEFVVRSGRVTSVHVGKGSAVIPTDGFVVSVSGKRKDELVALLKEGARVSLEHKTSYVNNAPTTPLVNSAEDAVAGVPQIIRDGKIDITVLEEKSSKEFSETRHPRTAFAILKDGKVLLAVFDGRQPGHSIGVSLQEMAEILLPLGADTAMNFDGGGSTTMFLDGKVVNKVSDKEGERAVSDALLVFVR